MNEGKKVQRNFRPWPENQERLVYAEQKLGLQATDLINEVLEKYLKPVLETKAKKLREALNVPIP